MCCKNLFINFIALTDLDFALGLAAGVILVIHFFLSQSKAIAVINQSGSEDFICERMLLNGVAVDETQLV
jgi:hypothetical protein